VLGLDNILFFSKVLQRNSSTINVEPNEDIIGFSSTLNYAEEGQIQETSYAAMNEIEKELGITDQDLQVVRSKMR